MTRALVAALLLSITVTAPGTRAEIAGRATIIDGDTIEIGPQRIRLFGIDAPEGGQTCVANTEWRCGEEAARALKRMIEAYSVYCTERDRDQYQRVVAVCHLSRPDGPDVNARMVREGWALAYRYYSTDYVGAEEAAKKDRVGVWRGSLLAPWDWRVMQHAKERAPSTRAANSQAPATSGDCNIKGNVSVKGERIYHVPDGEFYGATQISPSKGERWFCSEAEARAAGWRRSMR